MIDYSAQHPAPLQALLEHSERIGFTMNADHRVGSLLRTLTASRPGGNFLELGTGTGVALSWMLDGMDEHSSIISIDNDGEALGVAREQLGGDARLTLVEADAEGWIMEYSGARFDLIFADTWAGKYHTLEPTLQLLKPGGMWLIDDMIAQASWPEGHAERALALMQSLADRQDLLLTSLPWATGVILAVRR